MKADFTHHFPFPILPRSLHKIRACRYTLDPLSPKSMKADFTHHFPFPILPRSLNKIRACRYTLDPLSPKSMKADFKHHFPFPDPSTGHGLPLVLVEPSTYACAARRCSLGQTPRHFASNGVGHRSYAAKHHSVSMRWLEGTFIICMACSQIVQQATSE